jgi:arylsulfatase A-like enzyme
MSRRLAALCLFATLSVHPALARNVVIFVADGLRYDSVTPDIAPTLWKLRHDGVDFTNSHALYPTVTTANGSAIATGHYLGDTGDYANTLFVDFADPCRQGVSVIFVESDCILADLKDHFGDGFMGQTTLIQAARAAKFNTIIFGKTGPAAIQDLDSLNGNGVLIDEAANHPANPDGTPTKGPILKGGVAGLVAGATGLDASPGTAMPDVIQEAYQTSAFDALLPNMKDVGHDKRPLLILFWSRDPDFTQHNAVDSEGKLVPGINGDTQHRAIANADNALKSMLASLKRHGLDKDTDIFVTADHGFMTVAKGIPGSDGATPRVTLPQGFLAYDIADLLHEKAFDPDKANAELDRDSGDHPVNGSALIGPSPESPRVVIAANGGSDLVYITGSDAATARGVFARLAKAPYVGSLLVNDALLKGHEGDFKGALPMSALRLTGASRMPQPAMVVGFRSFIAKACKLPVLLCAAGVMDSPLRTGMGNHGGPSRAETRNFMAAIGPDFKAAFQDPTPVGNADIAPTIAHILGLSLGDGGELTGRIAHEALKGGKPVPFQAKVLRSQPSESGFRTVLQYQEADGRPYFDALGMPGRVVGLTAK